MSKKIPESVFGMDDIPANLTNEEMADDIPDNNSVYVGENETTKPETAEKKIEFTEQEKTAYDAMKLTKPKLKYSTPSDLYKSLKAKDFDPEDKDKSGMNDLHKEVKDFVAENADIAEEDFQKIRKKHGEFAQKIINKQAKFKSEYQESYDTWKSGNVELVAKAEAINRQSLQRRNQTKREKNQQKANPPASIKNFEINEADDPSIKEVKEAGNKLGALLMTISESVQRVQIDIQKAIVYEEENRKRIVNLNDSKPKRQRSG